MFRNQVQLNEDLKRQLSAIRAKGRKSESREQAKQELRKLRQDIGALDAAEAGTIVDIFLSFRALEDWEGMISLYDQMPEIMKGQILVREQLGFAYSLFRNEGGVRYTTRRGCIHALRTSYAHSISAGIRPARNGNEDSDTGEIGTGGAPPVFSDSQATDYQKSVVS